MQKIQSLALMTEYTSSIFPKEKEIKSLTEIFKQLLAFNDYENVKNVNGTIYIKYVTKLKTLAICNLKTLLNI